MLDPEIAGIARLEPIAFAADAIAEQRMVPDYIGDGVDLFLAGGVHDGNPSRWSNLGEVKPKVGLA